LRITKDGPRLAASAVLRQVVDGADGCADNTRVAGGTDVVQQAVQLKSCRYSAKSSTFSLA